MAKVVSGSGHARSAPTPRRGQQGAVLVVVLLMMVCLLGLGMTGLFLTSTDVHMNANINLRSQAMVVAEAGIERARAILNSLSSPNLAVLLAGSSGAADQVPATADQCTQARGAVLVDTVTCTNCPLLNVAYPSINRNGDLPSGSGLVPATTMGTYTVYLRQDLRDCRMGNFTCDNAADFAGPTCLPPSGAPMPNGAVVVRSEGLAADGRTMVALEVTMWPNQGATAALNNPFSQLCASGANGCDDNSSTQTGIVVNSAAPQAPPSPPVLAVGGAPGAGGVPGSGGTSGPGYTVMPGGGLAAGGTAAGGAAGGSGAGGSGGSGTGGSASGGSSGAHPCLDYAVSAVAACPTGCITLNSGVVVDGYDPGQGSYGGPNLQSADIAMTCSQGSDGCPNNCPHGCVTGSIDYGVVQNLNASTLPVPAHASSGNSVTVPPDTTLGPGYYSSIYLNGGTLTLLSGSYVVDSLNLNSGTLYIDDSNGPVYLWVTSGLSPNSVVAVKSGNPADFWLIYDGTGQINNNSGNDFTGVLFAPAASINLDYHVTGAVVGGQITMNGSAVVHYDSGLACAH